MWHLYQFPLCPFSRKVRLMLAEKGVAHELRRVSPWLQDDDFADLNPAGETPVLVEESKGVVLIDSLAICEYFEETLDKAPLIPGTASNRAEVRRLVSWFDGRMHHEVVAPLMEERMKKRLISRAPPDTTELRKAMTAANGHLDYIDYLLDHRRWLAGPALTLADLAAAAQLSVADYLGGVDWRGHKQTADWYAVMKSRPAFRPLLAERMEVIQPPAHYDKVDF
ncbi:glutathione S-transferase family protein [Sphingosinicella ginsenosidimutans]|uniref:Glutathione S-transferase family protein n=1 Tax=Allosphingosinicella ginsenosidimutans TaxID=1176539 RepID=A0A5C6TRK9_9SPHN|nr:glutathione S-transferase family protein [Sphingosinicella ginsenosidimutans]TXC63072.1 glutathione S-transferase family protein [Sphingosinicella ginsenosidimutans]